MQTYTITRRAGEEKALALWSQTTLDRSKHYGARTARGTAKKRKSTRRKR